MLFILLFFIRSIEDIFQLAGSQQGEASHYQEPWVRLAAYLKVPEYFWKVSTAPFCGDIWSSANLCFVDTSYFSLSTDILLRRQVVSSPVCTTFHSLCVPPLVFRTCGGRMFSVKGALAEWYISVFLLISVFFISSHHLISVNFLKTRYCFAQCFLYHVF